MKPENLSPPDEGTFIFIDIERLGPLWLRPN